MSDAATGSERDSELLELNNRPPWVASVLNLTVQGKKETYAGSPDVRSLLEAMGEDSAYANVRINGAVLNRRDFENIPLHEGDRVDFLYFMGGGSCSTYLKQKLSVIRGT